MTSVFGLELWAAVRWMHRVERWSIREIHLRTGLRCRTFCRALGKREATAVSACAVAVEARSVPGLGLQAAAGRENCPSAPLRLHRPGISADVAGAGRPRTRDNSSCSEQSRHPETERSAGACFPSPTSISSPSTDGLLCARKAVRRARHPSPGRCLARADERLAEPRLCPRVNPSAGCALARSCPAARLSPRVATRSALLLRLAGGPGADAPIAGR